MNYLENLGLVTRYATTQPIIDIPQTETVIIKQSSQPNNTVSFDMDKGIKLAIIAVLGALTIRVMQEQMFKHRGKVS